MVKMAVDAGRKAGPFLRPTGAKNERCSRDFWTDNNTARPKTLEPRTDSKEAGRRTTIPCVTSVRAVKNFVHLDGWEPEKRWREAIEPLPGNLFPRAPLGRSLLVL